MGHPAGPLARVPEQLMSRLDTHAGETLGVPSFWSKSTGSRARLAGRFKGEEEGDEEEGEEEEIYCQDYVRKPTGSPPHPPESRGHPLEVNEHPPASG